jgi:hypothetical protein
MTEFEKARRAALIRKANALLDKAEKCVKAIVTHAKSRNCKAA